jgi:ferredoxin-thioredoxin reductase catalytic subunit/rubredoxin
MNSAPDIPFEDIDRLHARLSREAEAVGYHLNPDTDFTKDLVRGLIVNEQRYGYWACPCRLASGTKTEDLDIICPCDYRDPDLSAFGMCYCGLYVTQDSIEGKKPMSTIPERRPAPGERAKALPVTEPCSMSLPLPVWRCKVCGYLCARAEPPEVCPICKVKKDRFERFL